VSTEETKIVGDTFLSSFKIKIEKKYESKLSMHIGTEFASCSPLSWAVIGEINKLKKCRI
jgi:hypothetical protein